MNSIYKTASRVRVWLGHDEANVAEDAVWMVHWLAEIFNDENKKSDFRRKYSEELGSHKSSMRIRPIAQRLRESSEMEAVSQLYAQVE